MRILIIKMTAQTITIAIRKLKTRKVPRSNRLEQIGRSLPSGRSLIGFSKKRKKNIQMSVIGYYEVRSLGMGKARCSRLEFRTKEQKKYWNIFFDISNIWHPT